MGERNDVDIGDRGTLPIIVHKFPGDHWVTAHPVRRKGADTWAIDTCARDLFEWGVVDFLYKSDQEPAILSFKTDVVAKFRVLVRADSDINLVRPVVKVAMEESDAG